ncbi:hypothetical protein [Paenibacillus donghaensis]|uniref:Uncharacterized protein n=1 Tax=Paenibacillus donghaensis TaxID=414771 RepID=A0A2Z2K7F6_9BACL|nr:hypothetical protein [Paenibacillus donghaensis]ASA20967.1 hypothetical protein B9T62_09315 [Paenibacillus donghaensis]
MINDFVDFVHELFPSISPYAKDNVKESIRQFEQSGKIQDYLLSQPLPHLAQGDIIEKFTFIKFDEHGNERNVQARGILLSNTCSAERDEQLLFAPLLPLADLDVNREKVQNNLNYRLLYIPDPGLIDYAVDFSIINSYPRKLIESSLQSERLRKSASLNKYGYYLFIAKLTVHLMRPEDTGVQHNRIAI